MNHTDRIRPPIQAHGSDYTCEVLTVTVRLSARPVDLDEKVADGQTPPKILQADVGVAFVDGRYQY